MRGALALLSVQPITWATGLLATILVPRYLGPDGFGEYSMAVAAAGLAGTFAALGIPSYLVRRVAEDRSRVMADGVVALVLVGAAGLAAGTLVSLSWPASGVQMSHPAIIWLAAAAVVVALVQQLLVSLLNGQERHARFAFVSAMIIAAGSLAGVSVLGLGADVVVFMGTSLTASAAAVILGWHVSGFRLSLESLSVKGCRDLLRGGLPFLGLNVSIFVRNQIDVLIVGLLLGTAASGWLAAAYRIVSVPMVAPIVLMRPLLPALTTCVDDPDLFRQTVRDTLVLVLFVTAPASALLIAVAPAVPDVLTWGSEFARSVPLIRVLALTVPVASIVIVLGTALLALKRERPWLVVTLIAAGFNAGGNLLGVPLAEAQLGNGALGATMVELATELILFGGALRLMPSRLIAPDVARTSLGIVVASVLLAGVSSALFPLGLLASVAGGGAVYLAATLALRVMPLAGLKAVLDDVLRTNSRREALRS